MTRRYIRVGLKCLFQTFGDLGMLGDDVFALADVVFQIVESRARGLACGCLHLEFLDAMVFPITTAHRRRPEKEILMGCFGPFFSAQQVDDVFPI